MNKEIKDLSLETKALLQIVGKIGMLIFDYSCKDLNEKQKEQCNDLIHVNYMFTDILADGTWPCKEVVERLLGHLDEKHGDNWLSLLKDCEERLKNKN